MQKWLTGLALLIIFSSFTQEPDFENLKNVSFGIGERLEYVMHYGIFRVGKGMTVVEPKTYVMNSRECFKVDVFAETLGFISWVSKVDDHWGAYIDTSAIVTHAAYRYIKEGPYRLDEMVVFDHNKDIAEVKVKDKVTGVFGPPKTFKTPDDVRDIIGGFLYLRVIDFESFKKGDTLTISGFFEDTKYSMKILYEGREVIKTELGKIKCIKLVPVMPRNTLFNGENSITAWISDDDNRIPVKVKANMFIGSAGVELTGFRGLRNQFRIIR